MRSDFEERLLRNPALGAVLVANFCEAYAGRSADGSAPHLAQILLAIPLLFHKPTVQRIYRMQFDSGLARAVAEEPEIVAGLQYRVQQMTLTSLQSVALGCGAGLIEREGGSGLPRFRSLRKSLGNQTDATGSVGNMVKASKRLGTWFASEPLNVVCRLLQVSF